MERYGIEQKGEFELKKKFATLFLCGTIIGNLYPAYANEITDYKIDNLLQVEGSLKEKDEGVLVNLWISKADTGQIVIVKQTQTDATGSYKFNIDLAKEMKSGGKFQLKTIAQTEGVDSENFEFYTEVEINGILLDIYEKQQDEIAVAKILSEKVDQLSFSNHYLRELINNEKAIDIAEFLKGETVTEENLQQVLKYIAIVKTIEGSIDPENILSIISNNTVLLELNENKVYNGLDEDDFPLFGNRLAKSSKSYEKRSDFIEDVEESILLADVYNSRGTDGILLTLEKYDTKLDFTVFETSGNDKTAVLKKILKGIEDETIENIQDIQDILDTKIKIQNSSNGVGASRGSGGGGFSGSSSSYQADNQLLSSDVFDENDLVTPDVIRFQDMSNHKWAEESVNALTDLGIINGYSNTEFVPDRSLSRAEFCKLLCCALEMEISNADAGFEDVFAKDWFSGYVWTLYHNSIVKGTDENVFSPNSEISRQDVCTILYRALSEKGLLNEEETDISYKDSDEVSDYAKTAIEKLSWAGLLKGKDGYCYPKASITRAEAAVLIHRVYEYVKGGTV